MEFNMWAIGGAIGLILVILATVSFLASRYRRCPANKVLVVSGKTGGDGKAAKCITGGGTFVWPIIQEFDYLDLTPMQLMVKLDDALSLENIRVATPATVTVAVGADVVTQQNAALRLLGLEQQEIQRLGMDIIVGQMRLVIASMKIDEINRDRDAFLQKIQHSLEPELKKIGLVLINVNITDIKDASGYIEATGKKAAAQAVQQALADVADQEKIGQVRVAEAKQEQAVKTAEQDRTKEIGIQSAARDKEIQVAELTKEKKIKIATANAEAAQGEAIAAVKTANAFQTAETAKAEAEGKVLVARHEAATAAAEAEGRRIEADQRAKQEAQAKAEAAAKIAQAEGEASMRIKLAQADAEAIKIKMEAEAAGQLAIANAKAEGLRKMVEATGKDAGAAYRLLMVDHIPEIVKGTAEAMKGIKMDNVQIWDSGNGQAIGGVASGLAKSIVPLMQIVNEITDLKVPGMKTDTPTVPDTPKK